MKLTRIILGLGLAALLFAQADVALQKAIRTELVQGDIRGAIKQYADIAAKYAKTDRATAAMALVHEAQAYQKLGDAESKKIFAQILKDYADQRDAVTLAKAQMGGSGTGAAGPIRKLVCEGSDCQGFLSPDGTSMLTSGSGLRILDLATHQTRVLVDPVAGTTQSGVMFSSDGSRIAYTSRLGPSTPNSYENQTIEVVNSDGSGRRAVYRGAWGLAWSPDGKRLLADRISAGKPRDAHNLVWVDVTTGATQNLPTEHPYFDSAKVSPDGRYVAFTAGKDGQAEENVSVMASDGSGETVVAPSAVYQEPVGWTPDGKYLLYDEYSNKSERLWAQAIANGRPQGEPLDLHAEVSGEFQSVSRSGVVYSEAANGPQAQLEVAPFDSAAGKVLAPPTTVWSIAQQNTVREQYDWSPDGKYLAFMAPDARSRSAVLIRSMETGVTRIVPSEGMKLGAADLRWAPDSRTLLVGGMNEIHSIDTSTDKISTFKADGLPAQGLMYMPAWSPDGKKIYFAAKDTDGKGAFFESDPDLKNLRQVVSNTGGGLNLTPDGRTIITPMNSVTTVIPLSGGAPRPMYSSGTQTGKVIFISPDGKYVVLASVRSSTPKQTSAWIVPTAGGDLREIFKVEPALSVGMGMWAADSKSIFLRTLDAAGQQVAMWRVPVDGSSAVKVDTGLNLDQNIRFATANSTGNWIAFVRGTPPAEPKTWVLENYLPQASK